MHPAGTQHTRGVLWGPPSGAGVARKLEEGQSRPWKDSHSCIRSREGEASADSGLGRGHRQKVHGDLADSPG